MSSTRFGIVRPSSFIESAEQYNRWHDLKAAALDHIARYQDYVMALNDTTYYELRKLKHALVTIGRTK